MFKTYSRRLLGFLVAAALLVGTANAADMERRHSIDLSFGYYGNSGSVASIGTPGYNVKIMNDDMTGKVAYNYFLNDTFAFQLSLGIFQPKFRFTTQSVGTSSIIPVLLGIKYYPFRLPDSHIRPYAMTAAGLVIGSAAGTGPYFVRAHTERAVLLNLGLGCDFELGSLVKLTSGIDYNFSTDFSNPVAGSENYRGVEFFFGFGFMF